jgi:hypothetical protein
MKDYVSKNNILSKISCNHKLHNFKKITEQATKSPTLLYILFPFLPVLSSV